MVDGIGREQANVPGRVIVFFEGRSAVSEGSRRFISVDCFFATVATTTPQGGEKAQQYHFALLCYLESWNEHGRMCFYVRRV